MDVPKTLAKLKELVEKEKQQLDYLIRGGQLLADMLLAEEQSGNKPAKEQRSEPSVEENHAGQGEKY